MERNESLLAGVAQVFVPLLFCQFRAVLHQLLQREAAAALHRADPQTGAGRIPERGHHLATCEARAHTHTHTHTQRHTCSTKQEVLRHTEKLLLSCYWCLVNSQMIMLSVMITRDAQCISAWWIIGKGIIVYWLFIGIGEIIAYRMKPFFSASECLDTVDTLKVGLWSVIKQRRRRERLPWLLVKKSWVLSLGHEMQVIIGEKL